MQIKFKQRLRFMYKNYKGEVDAREVLTDYIFFGSSEFHKEPQWLMLAWDYNKQDNRQFAMRDMSEVVAL